jgi:hypothetical protein
MTTVKILSGYVGEWGPGDIVKDAPDGLVQIAKHKIKNAATGEMVAEIVEGEEDRESIDELKSKWEEREKELLAELDKSKKREEELLSQLRDLQPETDELKELKSAAKELKITGYTKMDADELKKAISAAGGEEDGK